jgi:3-methyladenine DNA glycosylase AlkD
MDQDTTELTTEGQKQKARLLAKIRKALVTEEMTADGRAVLRRCISILDAAKTDGEIMVAMAEGKALMAIDIARNNERTKRAEAEAKRIGRRILQRMPHPERLS